MLAQGLAADDAGVAAYVPGAAARGTHGALPVVAGFRALSDPQVDVHNWALAAVSDPVACL